MVKKYHPDIRDSYKPVIISLRQGFNQGEIAWLILTYKCQKLSVFGPVTADYKVSLLYRGSLLDALYDKWYILRLAKIASVEKYGFIYGDIVFSKQLFSIIFPCFSDTIST